MKGRGSRTQSLFLSIIIHICVLVYVCVWGGGGTTVRQVQKRDGGGGTWFDRQFKMDTDALITFVKPRFSTCIT